MVDFYDINWGKYTTMIHSDLENLGPKRFFGFSFSEVHWKTYQRF